MLSIRFDDEREWWVSGGVFEGLFLSALEHGQVSPELAEWRFVADANGGLSLNNPGAATELATGLRAAAAAEVARLGDVDTQSEDGPCKESLEKLLALTLLTKAARGPCLG